LQALVRQNWAISYRPPADGAKTKKAGNTKAN
jgi:hypothetical protein